MHHVIGKKVVQALYQKVVSNLFLLLFNNNLLNLFIFLALLRNASAGGRPIYVNPKVNTYY